MPTLHYVRALGGYVAYGRYYASAVKREPTEVVGAYWRAYAAWTQPLAYPTMPSLNRLLTDKMSSTATKLALPAPRVLLLSTAVFIFLSGCQAKETRKCHWCGPLAEQVHRSQRAPPCDSIEKQVTNCDPGFPHCAVVATAPPFVESRYCVKLYQDECYALFCNSTKSWRMTCPCRGDLCNGPNSDREKEAFKTLAKLTEKTNYIRIKRAVIASSNFINKRNDANEMISENNNNAMLERVNKMNITVDNATDVIPAQAINDDSKEMMPTDQTKTTDLDNSNDKTSELNKEAKETTVTLNMNSSVEKTVEISSTEMISKKEKIKFSSEATSVSLEEMPKETPAIKNVILTTEKLPTAEALQQNTSPVEKNKESVTTETTTTTGQSNMDMTVMPTSSKNNTGAVFQNQLPTLIAGIILNQFL